jgi:hypothetical protein
MSNDERFICFLIMADEIRKILVGWKTYCAKINNKNHYLWEKK